MEVKKQNAVSLLHILKEHMVKHFSVPDCSLESDNSRYLCPLIYVDWQVMFDW